MTNLTIETGRASTPGSASLEAGGAFLIGSCLPDEAQALASSGSQRALFLSPAEEAHYLRFRNEKRRIDWLSGRLAAKRALTRYFRQTEGSDAEPSAMEIASDEQGAPVCALEGSPFFSISHCISGGICAVGLTGRRVGIDWETVAPRSQELAQLFARPGELLGGQNDPHSQTRLWAVKEAVLKLLGLGLTVPPRDVEVGARIRLHGQARRRWEQIGSPAVSLTAMQQSDSVIAVVHT